MRVSGYLSMRANEGLRCIWGDDNEICSTGAALEVAFCFTTLSVSSWLPIVTAAVMIRGRGEEIQRPRIG